MLTVSRIPFAAAALLIALLTGAAALAIEQRPTHVLVERSYTSAGVTCYYVCPPFVGEARLFSFYSPTTTCIYELNDGYFPCKYLSDNGQVYGNSDVKCPAQADQGGCGTMPNNGFRKRSAPKKLTPLEELVASRQYDPKAHTGTVPLVEQEAAARFVLAE